MAYSEEDTTKLLAIMQGIRERQEDTGGVATFRDAADLATISAIVEEHLANESHPDAETLDDTMGILRFVANSYDEMRRFSLASAFYTKLIATEIALSDYVSDADFLETIGEDFDAAVIARNRLSQDECTDLLEYMAELFPVRKIQTIYESALERASFLCMFDPVEGTDAYLACIDAVEAALDEAELSPDTEAYDQAKAELLAEQGVTWQPPKVVRQTVSYDTSDTDE